MDFSSLPNNLPNNTKPIPTSLTTDFKSAALALTRLYQNSFRQIDLARQQGYLSAVQEVAALLSSGELAGDRLREWCAVGLSRISAMQEDDDRARNSQRSRTDEEEVDMHERGSGDHMDMSSSQYTFYRRREPEVTFEVIGGGSDGGGVRKRGVAHHIGSTWDGNTGNKRSRNI
jgi:hypothetical protein